MRDWQFHHETMPTETDEQFLDMVAVATCEHTMSSAWMPRLVEIASRKLHAQKPWWRRLTIRPITFTRT